MKSMKELDATILIAQRKLVPSERIRFSKTIGIIFATVSDELYAYLVSQDPDLRGLLFPSSRKTKNRP